MKNNHDLFYFGRRVISLAEKSTLQGNHPFAALLVVDNVVACEALNKVLTSNDPTQHAEIVLLQKLAKMDFFKKKTKGDVVLYASTEPCIMCSGAIYWAGIQRVVFATSKATLGKYAGDDFLYPCDKIFSCGTRPVDLVGPILEAEGAVIHSKYWSFGR